MACCCVLHASCSSARPHEPLTDDGWQLHSHHAFLGALLGRAGRSTLAILGRCRRPRAPPRARSSRSGRTRRGCCRRRSGRGGPRRASIIDPGARWRDEAGLGAAEGGVTGGTACRALPRGCPPSAALASQSAAGSHRRCHRARGRWGAVACWQRRVRAARCGGRREATSACRRGCGHRRRTRGRGSPRTTPPTG